MKLSKTGKWIDQRELEERLKAVHEKNPDLVLQFAARCAFRVFPLINEGDLLSFLSHRRRHVVAIFLACSLTNCASRPAWYLRGAAHDAISDIPPSYEKATHAAYAASVSFNTSISGIAEIASTYSAGSSSAEDAFLAAQAVFSDLSLIEMNESLEHAGIWSGASPENWGVLTQNLYRALEAQDLFELTADLKKVYSQGLYALESKPWDKYEPVWRTLEAEYRADRDQMAGAAKPSRYRPSSKMHREGPSTQDHLNRDSLAKAMAQRLNDKDSSEHLTVGLFGDWGVGKSTFVNLLKSKLTLVEPPNYCEEFLYDDSPARWNTLGKSVGCAFYRVLLQPFNDLFGVVKRLFKRLCCGKLKPTKPVYIHGEFNAWSYEHSGNIQAGLAQEFVKACVKGMHPLSRFTLTVRYALHANPRSVLYILAASLGSLYLFEFTSELNLPTNFQDAPGYIGVATFAVLTFHQFKKILAHPMANELKTYLRLPDFGADLGKLPVMRENIAALAKVRLHPGLRLLFVVDDLDRCSPEGVVKTFEAVRLAVELENVVVVIAIDQKIALASLALHYEQLAKHHHADPIAIARDYLGKVVHLPLILDPPPHDDVAGYLQHHLWAGSAEPKEESEKVRPDIESDESTSGTGGPVPPEKGDVKHQNSIAGGGADEPYVNPMPDLTERPSPEPQEEIRDGLSDAQKQQFITWVERLNLSNPRQLKRLDNAYNLLRHRYTDEDRAESHPRLAMLLFLEYLGEKPADERQMLTSVLLGEAADIWRREEGDLHRLRPSPADQACIDNIRSELGKSVEAIYKQVNPFVLPAIEMESLAQSVLGVVPDQQQEKSADGAKPKNKPAEGEGSHKTSAENSDSAGSSVEAEGDREDQAEEVTEAGS